MLNSRTILNGRHSHKRTKVKLNKCFKLIKLILFNRFKRKLLTKILPTWWAKTASRDTLKVAIVKEANAWRNTVSASKLAFLVTRIANVPNAKTMKAPMRESVFSSTTLKSPPSSNNNNKWSFSNKVNHRICSKQTTEVAFKEGITWISMAKTAFKTIRWTYHRWNPSILTSAKKSAQIHLALISTLSFVRCRNLSTKRRRWQTISKEESLSTKNRIWNRDLATAWGWVHSRPSSSRRIEIKKVNPWKEMKIE